MRAHCVVSSPPVPSRSCVRCTCRSDRLLLRERCREQFSMSIRHRVVMFASGPVLQGPARRDELLGTLEHVAQARGHFVQLRCYAAARASARTVPNDCGRCGISSDIRRHHSAKCLRRVLASSPSCNQQHGCSGQQMRHSGAGTRCASSPWTVGPRKLRHAVHIVGRHSAWGVPPPRLHTLG